MKIQRWIINSVIFQTLFRQFTIPLVDYENYCRFVLYILQYENNNTSNH
jgi:hypothetical protein